MKKIMILLAFLLLVPNSYALKLEGINGIEILAINGNKVKTSFLTSENRFELKPGYHQIVVWYSKDFDDGDETARSFPMIFALDLQEDTQISVENYYSLDKAERAIKKGLTFQIISAKKQYDVTDAPRLTENGFSVFSNVETLIITYNRKHNIAIAGTKGVDAPSTIVGLATGTSDKNSTSILNQIALYQQSTPAQQKAFRKWLAEQEAK